MKEVNQMTEEDVANAFAVVMDTSEQERLMNNPDDPDCWMLDFVYDSELLNELEDYSKKLTEANALNSLLPTNDGKEAKIKI
jgi:hypothetical protein